MAKWTHAVQTHAIQEPTVLRITSPSLLAQLVKSLPEMQETLVWSMGQEDPLEKEMATHSSIIAWRIPWTEEPGGLQSMGSQRVRNNWKTNTFTFSAGWSVGNREPCWVFNGVWTYSLRSMSPHDSAVPLVPDTLPPYHHHHLSCWCCSSGRLGVPMLWVILEAGNL